MEDLAQIHQVFDTEIKALIEMKNAIPVINVDIISLIDKCKGKIVFLGVGKGKMCALKAAATFSRRLLFIVSF